MAILPEGFTLPPPAYLAALVAAAALVTVAVARRRPAVTQRRVLAFAPWMVLGSAVHVLYVAEALPAVFRPFGGTPSVYVAVGTVGVAAWTLADAALEDTAVPQALAAVGSVLALGTIAVVVDVGLRTGTLSPVVPAGALVAASVLAGVVWFGLTRIVPEVRVTGALGAFVIFAHVLDGVSTAVGIDVLGFGERTPLSRVIVEFAAGLPTEPLLGSGWLFVLVKVGVASLVVWLFADIAREEPTQAQLLLGLVAAVGFGPAVHNLLLFTIAVPA